MELVTLILACSVYADNAIVNAMIELDSGNNPLVVSGKPFKTEAQALSYVTSLKSQGEPFEIGLMQIPDHALKKSDHAFVNFTQLLRPCKNTLLATQLLNQAQMDCQNSVACALSRYKTGDGQSEIGREYADKIMNYALDYPFIIPKPTE